MRILFFLSFILLLSGCFYDGEDHRSLAVNNQTSNPIFSIISSDDSIGTLNYYNGFPSQYNGYIYDFPEIEPKCKSNSNDRPRLWSELFKKAKNNKIRLFIVEKDLVLKYGWDTIINQNKYTYKFIVSEQDLDKNGWQLMYEEN